MVAKVGQNWLPVGTCTHDVIDVILAREIPSVYTVLPCLVFAVTNAILLR